MLNNQTTSDEVGNQSKGFFKLVNESIRHIELILNKVKMGQENMILEKLKIQARNNERKRLVELLATQPLWWVGGKEYLLDTQQGIIWYASRNQLINFDINSVKAKQTYTDFPILGLPSQIPTVTELRKFSQYKQNPIRTEKEYGLLGCYIFLASDHGSTIGIDLEEGYENSRHNGNYPIIWCNRKLAKDLSSLIDLLIEKGVKLTSLKDTNTDLLQTLKQIEPAGLARIDYNRCRLPELDPNRFTDVNQGLWELWRHENWDPTIRARDPAKDIQTGNIGIDFGTSSTVVAYEDKNGRSKLLRIGVKDFYEAAKPEHYENPTVLEFVDFKQFQSAWNAMAYQPLVSWDDVRCSHEAQANFRDNDSDPKVVGSILAKIKQWALREANDTPIRLTDQINGFEHELAHLQEHNPTKGQKLEVTSNYAFDPVELYAWFLGLNINWRGRGIFLKYYMTFPVAYPKTVKEKILASFRRGLLRSLPESLMDNVEAMNRFSVEERASEPAAYATVAMKALGIEPPDDESRGIAYSVFDFGGGTTDFDYGYYRWSNEEEEAKGIEEVFEHFESAGDKFLGGENILENLAYLVFKHNIQRCREYRISFSKPLDADDFAGSELLIERTQSAHTNTLMMMSALREFWQVGKTEKYEDGVVTLSMVLRSGETEKVEFSLPIDHMQQYLEYRIARGIESFLSGMKNAFTEGGIPQKIHVLLAGNSSRSPLVTEAFGLNQEDNNTTNSAEKTAENARFARTQKALSQIFGETPPRLIAHKPLEADSQDESKPTAKTGVALGILRLCPGSPVKVINHTVEAGEAPFAHFVGRIRRGKFVVGIKRNETYHEWKEIGVVTEDNAFKLFHTTSPLALSGDMREGSNELYYKSLNFADNSAGHKVYARAIAPDVIEVCTAENIDQIKGDNLQELKL